MKQVALIRVIDHDSYYDNMEIIDYTLTNWETVTEDDYKLLKNNIHFINQGRDRYFLITKPSKEEQQRLLIRCIDDAKKQMQEEMEKEAIRIQERENKRKEKELKQLKKLQSKYIDSGDIK